MPKTNESPLSFPLFLLLLILALIKDITEVVIGFIPGLDAVSWLFSLPFAAVITLIIFLLGIHSTWVLIGQLFDLIPIASILPITTLSVIGLYAVEKSPHLKKAAKVATKVIPSTKNAASNITKDASSLTEEASSAKDATSTIAKNVSKDTKS